ncbi:MAG TPA: PadR family transcriptional regulator [Usitatibacteraceae bacterium]|nr:PadR family transcriptional regulator [Usitatibacteraceae bacterium]
MLREIFLGFIRAHLLHHAARRPFFGAEMIEELRHHGYDVSPGTLYPILHKLGKAGYLACEPVVVEGKVRKYYRATPAGRDLLAEVIPKVKELTEELLEDHAPEAGPFAAPAKRKPARKASKK